MRVDEFDYRLPQSLIAQYPSPVRGETRLMVIDRDRASIEHRRFSDILDYLRPGDLLVHNNTRVLPARVFGESETGRKVELLLLPCWNGRKGVWRALVRNSRKLKGRTLIRFGDGIEARLEIGDDGRGEIEFPGQVDVPALLHRIGHIPLPPYIKRTDEILDRDRYQTIFAERDGSVAAPTAALHFTEPLLRSIRDKGVKIAKVTLHIGAATFAPLKVKEVENHQMEEEWAEVSEEAVRQIREAKKRGGRVIAVGTTTTRTLESFTDEEGRVTSGSRMTSLFIYPPYHFRVVDGLVTNFHLPKSTLIMLVCAFAGKDLIMKAYEEAVKERYRFYSYGDAMLII